MGIHKNSYLIEISDGVVLIKTKIQLLVTVDLRHLVILSISTLTLPIEVRVMVQYLSMK